MSVVWSQADGPAGGPLDDQPAGTPGGGRRIFAESLSPDDPTVADQVNVRVQLAEPIAGITVWMRLYDVDDPSSSESPLDDESLTSDNRGAGVDLGVFSGVTDANGVVVFTVHVSHQPGDNFRAVATDVPTDDLNHDVYAKQNDGDQAGVYYTNGGSAVAVGGPAAIVSSGLLTVWRHLYVERDHMRAPPAGEVFENQEPTKDVAPAVDLPDAPIELLRQQLVPAYIAVVDIGNRNLRPTVDWYHNLGISPTSSDASTNAITHGARDVVGSDNYWVFQLVTAYEGPQNYDNDPPPGGPVQDPANPGFVTLRTEGALLGLRSKYSARGAKVEDYVLVFTETIRDVVADGTFGTRTWDGTQWGPLEGDPVRVTEAELLARVVYHEAIHLFGINHTMPAGQEGIHVSSLLVGGTADQIKLTSKQLYIIRSALGLR